MEMNTDRNREIISSTEFMSGTYDAFYNYISGSKNYNFLSDVLHGLEVMIAFEKSADTHGTKIRIKINMEDNIFKKYLSEYLKAYWLRPVTALVRTLDAMQLNFDEHASSKSLELACGDVNSYIAAGGGAI